VAKDYNKMRDAILAEFKLSPNMYLDRFNNLTRGTEETTVMFASRLESLLDYYLEARKVKQFPHLRALIICDRIKATLSVPCLRYILSVEATKEKGWMSVSELTTDIKKYLSTHVGDRPRAYAIGTTSSQNANNALVGMGSFEKTSLSKPAHPKNANNSNVGQGQAGSSSMGGGIRRCHVCNRPSHLQAQCPNNPIKTHGTAFNNNFRNVKKINAIQISSNAKRTRGGYRNRKTYTSSQCQTENDSPEVNSDLSNDSTNEMLVQENAIADATALFGGNPSGHGSVYEVVAVVKKPQNLDSLESAIPVSGNVSKQKSASQGVPLEQMSQLSYLPVRISEAPSTGKYRVVNALINTGSEIAVVSRKNVTDFDCAPLA